MSFNTLTSLQSQHNKFSMTWLSKIPVTTIPLQISTDEVKYNEVLVTGQLQN
jgi:hypothetical protein